MLEDVQAKLKEYNQEHLLKFYEELNEEEKEHLLDQIGMIDFDLIGRLFKRIGYKKSYTNIEAMPSYDFKEEYVNIGFEPMKRGEYAAVTMAGGQGTRLGFNGPKGTYVLEYGINKSLFEIHCDKLKHIYEITRTYTPWYIMTSRTNNYDTIKFFEDNNYFNYPKEKISFFIQDELPMIDTKGKIIMDSKYNIKMGANGSGGVYSSLARSGIIEKMKDDHIKWILIGGIDNILTPFDRP
jgi:UDP-N-acetylglucosamine/UDP-N-acetylgalactosamine diphosphorylase